MQWAFADQASPQSAEERRALVVLARAPRMPAAPAAPVRPGHVVYHAFSASYDWQVSVGLGEAVEVIETHEDGWSTVSTLSGKRGMVPKGYLRPLGAPVAAPASEFAVWSGDPDEIVAAAPPSDVKRVSESPPKPPPPPPAAASPDVKRVSPDAVSPDIRRVVTASPDTTSAPAASPKKKPPPPPAKMSPRKPPPPPTTPSPRQLKPPPPPRREPPDASSPDVKQIQKATPRKPPPPPRTQRSFSSPRDSLGRPPPPPKSHRRQHSEGSMGSMNSRLSHESAQFENN